MNINMPGWADAYGKAMADKDEEAKCEATGLTPRRNFPINRERMAASARKGSQKRRRSLPRLFAEDAEK
jgi:hypothetical protein